MFKPLNRMVVVIALAGAGLASAQTLSAHGNEHYTITTSAFVPAE